MIPASMPPCYRVSAVSWLRVRADGASSKVPSSVAITALQASLCRGDRLQLRSYLRICPRRSATTFRTAIGRHFDAKGCSPLMQALASNPRDTVKGAMGAIWQIVRIRLSNGRHDLSNRDVTSVVDWQRSQAAR